LLQLSIVSTPLPGSDEWRALVDEPVVDPERRIVDPHHHLWPGGPLPYSLADLFADVGSGHRVERTVFIECRAAYRTHGPAALESVGETEWVAAEAERSGGLIAGIVGHADLRRSNLDEILDAHTEAGCGRFRGIRDALARAEPSDRLMIAGGAPTGLFEDPSFRAGVARLGARGLTYDSWHYHYQNREFLALARAVPDTVMILDHFGTPIGIGRYADRRDAIFDDWQRDIADIARCENVVAKLGGLAMPDNGFGWNGAERPPTSDEFVAAQGRYYRHTIECFGAERCMFESNFPVDRMSLSYRVLWNGFKKLVRECSDDEREALFAGTATRVYRLECGSGT
jgi:predicted TIM-barrel fold metal-dependent hydrolase